MAVDNKKSEIIKFYKDKNILITGASGFLGRLLVEKLLRLCSVNKLYILVRTKKGTSPKDRLQSLFQVPLFDELRSLNPNFMDALELVEGDCSLPELGIQDKVRAALLDNVHIVIHGAATVNFTAPLKKSTAINVCGTRDIAILCRKMKNFQALVHVSTAFCHCPRNEIGEMFYDAPLTADNLIKLTECLNDDQLEKISKTIMAEWPNSYAFTKAIAEDAIRKYAAGLPACVFRPAIVISTVSDPIEGWIDNIYGPSGIVAGAAVGLVRVMRSDLDAKADFVPADLCINGIMAAAYKTFLLGPDSEIPIFNFTTSKDNILTFRKFQGIAERERQNMPSMQAMWFSTLTSVKSAFWFNLLIFLCHIVPAFIVDTLLIILRKKPQAIKIYRKIHKFAAVLCYFGLKSWDFHNNNLHALWNGLNKTDQTLFNFDMSKLDWDVVLTTNLRGIRKYILKEDESNISAAKRKMFFLHILHRSLQLTVLVLVTWFLSALTPAVVSMLQWSFTHVHDAIHV